jgi:L-serine dehydratase
LGPTGKGHGSDKAVLLGLLGHELDTVDLEAIPALLTAVRSRARLTLLGGHEIDFVEQDDLRFHRRECLPFHANGMRCIAFDATGSELANRCDDLVGGGFVVSDEVAADGTRHKAIAPDTTVLPHPFRSADELLRLTREHGCSMAALMRRNERFLGKAGRTDAAIDAGLLKIWRVMQDCVERGCRTDGVLPGGFKVRRRAKALHEALTARPEAATDGTRAHPLSGPGDPLQVLDWIHLCALAVNEENAAGGRVVTAPPTARRASSRRSCTTTPAS